MSVPTVKVRPTHVSTGKRAQATKEPTPLDLFREVPVPEKGKGFIRKCVEIIIQDTKDRLYADRKRRREEYERFCELASGDSHRGNGHR